MPRILKRAAAKRDLIDHFVFLAENASVDVAHRFLESTNEAFSLLADMPEIGAPRTFRNPRFASVRMSLVKGFERYLMFYRPLDGGIEVLRVLHGSRNIQELFR